MQTLNNPFEPLQIKWEVNIVKEVFLRLYPVCVVYHYVRPSLTLRLLFLRAPRYDTEHENITTGPEW